MLDTRFKLALVDLALHPEQYSAILGSIDDEVIDKLAHILCFENWRRDDYVSEPYESIEDKEWKLGI